MKKLFGATIAISLTLSVTAAPLTKSDFDASVKLRENWITKTRDLMFPVSWLNDKHEFAYRPLRAALVTLFNMLKREKSAPHSIRKHWRKHSVRPPVKRCQP